MKVEYNVSQVQHFLDDFNKITKLNIAMYDADKHLLYWTPHNSAALCSCISSSKAGKMRCTKSEFIGLCEVMERHDSEVYSYRCHAGMLEHVVPIKYESNIVGFIIFGQMLNGEEGETENIRKCCSDLINDSRRLDRLIGKLKLRKDDYVNSVARILQSCIQNFINENMFRIQTDSTWLLIDQYINENLRQKISINQIAAFAFCSPSTVSHKTKHITGLSVSNLIKQRRLSQAVVLLGTTDYNIGEIAALVGFEDYNYFTRVFRSTYGYPPHEYRKSIRH